MQMAIQKQRTVYFWLLVLVLILVACAPQGDSADQLQNTEVEPQPSETPTVLPRTAILLISPDSDPQLVAETEQIVRTYTVEQGLEFETRETLNGGDIQEGVELVVILGPYEGIADLAVSASQVRIIGITVGEHIDAANLQLISLEVRLAEQAAFVAGYTAALSTEDWRVGVLHTQETTHLAEAFIAGMEFFCGSCLPVRPPYIDYPLSAGVDSVQNWQSGADQLLGQAVKTVYLTPELELPEVQQYFFNRSVLLVGRTLSSPDFASGWLASIGGDSISVLRLQLPLALEGIPMSVGPSSLTLNDANGLYLSEARVQHIYEIIADLLNGYIALPSAE